MTSAAFRIVAGRRDPQPRWLAEIAVLPQDVGIPSAWTISFGIARSYIAAPIVAEILELNFGETEMKSFGCDEFGDVKAYYKNKLDLNCFSP